MSPRAKNTIDVLRSCALSLEDRSHVPYSHKPETCVLLLSDGSWVPGVRVESASFSLVLLPVISAVATTRTGRRSDVIAVVQNGPLKEEDVSFMRGAGLGNFAFAAEDALVRSPEAALPEPRDQWLPFLQGPPVKSPEDGILLARKIAAHAYVPESAFPVGCVLQTSKGHLIPGVNVEHPDWTRIICAERCALGTAFSYGSRDLDNLYLTCLNSPLCTPCGACRQLIAELAPDIKLFMDRGGKPAAPAHPAGLLPDFFGNESLSGS